jgi:hypothetical protein
MIKGKKTALMKKTALIFFRSRDLSVPLFERAE